MFANDSNKIISSKFFNFISRCYSDFPNNELDLTLQGKSLNKYICSLLKEYESLSDPNNTISSSRKRVLEPIICSLNKRNKILENLKNLKELLQNDDADLKELAKQEQKELEAKIKEADENLLLALIPKDKDETFDSLILEVQAGVGGQEAMLFAKEVFDMYQKFVAYKGRCSTNMKYKHPLVNFAIGWEHTVAEYLRTDLGGIREATALIHGPSAFQYLRHEAGIHRVQRIPSTEKGGRIHTSTISVIVLPEPSDIEIKVDPKDLKIEVKRASGAGGQHVNKTESAVRIVHLPTGIAVECQQDRSQIRNRKMAMAKLSVLLYENQMAVQQAEEMSSRKSQVKTRNRNEKIRTYNFKDDRVSDHRIGVNCYDLKRFFEGGDALNNLIMQLDEKYKLNKLLNHLSNIK